MMRLRIDQRQEVLPDVLAARLLLPRLLLLIADGDLVEGDDPPEVIPLLDQDVVAAPVPGRQAVEVVAADQQHADAALADDLAVLAGDRQQPGLARERRGGQAPRDAVDHVVDDLEAGRPLGGEDRVDQRGLLGQAAASPGAGPRCPGAGRSSAAAGRSGAGAGIARLPPGRSPSDGPPIGVSRFAENTTWSDRPWVSCRHWRYTTSQPMTTTAIAWSSPSKSFSPTKSRIPRASSPCHHEEIEAQRSCNPDAIVQLLSSSRTARGRREPPSLPRAGPDLNGPVNLRSERAGARHLPWKLLWWGDLQETWKVGPRVVHNRDSTVGAGRAEHRGDEQEDRGLGSGMTW